MYPLFCISSFSTSNTGIGAASGAGGAVIAVASSSRSDRSVMAFATFGPKPMSRAWRSAARKVMSFRSANDASCVSVAGPMPRFGVLRMRRTASASAGFATAIRYAMASLISARS